MSPLEQVAGLVGQMDEEQTRQVVEICRRRIGALGTVKVATFRPGMKVSFTHKGERHVGTVSKLNQKTVSVKVPHEIGGMSFPQEWKVSPGFLTAEPS